VIYIKNSDSSKIYYLKNYQKLWKINLTTKVSNQNIDIEYISEKKNLKEKRDLFFPLFFMKKTSVFMKCI